jgi:Asp/Glu/hydantoin racemase
MIRVWYQSFTDPTAHTGYLDKLSQYLRTVADPDTTFEFGGVTPPASTFGRLTELRCGVHGINRALDAQARGFDAVVLGHFQGPGLFEMRASLDIPVAGIGEASMHYALHLARSLGLVTIHPSFRSIHLEQADLYGVAERLVGVTAMDAPFADVVGSFTDPGAAERTLHAFEVAAAPLIDLGADVLIPAGGLPSLLLVDRPGYRVGRTPVLNPLSIAVKRAEMEVKLHRLTGLLPSHTNTFSKSVAKAVEEFRDATNLSER